MKSKTMSFLAETEYGKQWLFFDGSTYSVVIMSEEIADQFAMLHGATFRRLSEIAEAAK